MDVIDAINTRRTIRKYRNVPLEWDKVLSILEAGRMAPSAGNVQNWRFVLVTSPKRRLEIAEGCLQQYWIAQAPVVIVVVAEPNRSEWYYGERGAKVYTIQNCAAAVQNMLLAAQELGVGAAWVGAFDEPMIHRLVEAPEGAVVQAVLPLGYADEHPQVPPRLDLAVLIRFDKYGQRYKDIVEMSHEYSVYVARAIEETREWWAKIKKKIQDVPKKV